MREGLLEFRKVPEQDYSVGLGRKYPAAHARFPSSLATKPYSASTRSKLPKRSWGSPGSFSGGDKSKYEDIVQEYQTGEPASVCKPGKWEEAHTLLHKEILEGKREPSLLTYNCDGRYGCGGLADRYVP